VAVFAVLLVAGGTLFVVHRRGGRAQRRYNMGRLHLAAGDAETARESFASALSATPGFLAAQKGIVEALVAEKLFAEAETAVDKYAEMGADESEAALLRAKVLSVRAARRFSAAGDRLDVELCDSVISEDIEPAISLVAEHADRAEGPALAYAQLGDLYMRKVATLAAKGRALRAAAETAESLDKKEEAADKRGQALLVFAERDQVRRQALRAYGRAIELETDLRYARRKIAGIHLGAPVPRLDRAREVLTPIIELEPGDRDARLLLARAENLAGNHKEAIEHLDAITSDEEQETEDFGLLLARARILVDAKEWQEAEPLTEKLVSLQPFRPEAAYRRACVLLREEAPEAKALDQAISHLQNVFRKLPHHPRARFKLAEALKQRGNREQAISAYKQVLADVEAAPAGNLRDAQEWQTLKFDSCRKLAEELKDENPKAAAKYARQAIEALRDRAGAAVHALAAGGGDVELCERALAETIEPAIAFAQDHVDEAADPAPVHTDLGDLHVQKSQVLHRKFSLLRAAAQTAASQENTEEADRTRAQAFAAAAEAREARRAAQREYLRAIDLDPTLVRPRLQIAQRALSAYMPRPDQARAVLAPIIEREPDHRDARLMLARAEHLMGNHKEALAHLDAIAGQEQYDLVRMLIKAEFLVDAEQWEEAEPLTEKLISLQPDYPASAYLRARVLLHEDTPEALDQAISHLQNVFHTVRHDPRARLDLARALRRRGDHEEAVSAYEQVLADLEAAPARNLKDALAAKEHEYDACLALADELKDENRKAAVKYARQALETFPDRAEAFAAARRAILADDGKPEEIELLVLVHAGGIAARGELARAAAVCQRETESQDPAWGSRVRLLRARLLARAGAYIEAEKAYEELREAFPGKRPAYELAALLARLGRRDDARKIYEELLQADPDSQAALAGLVDLLLRGGDTEGARAAVLRLRSEGRSAVTDALLVTIYVREGKTEEAIEIARSWAEAAEAEPERLTARVLLAELSWKAGRLGDARAAFDEALGLDPGHFPAYRRGLLDLQEGKNAEAISLYEQARERSPNRLTPVVHLAVALQAGGRPQEALKVLQGIPAGMRPSRSAVSALRWYLAVMNAGMGNLEAATAYNGGIGLTDFGLPKDREDLLARLARAEEPLRQEAATALVELHAFRRGNCAQAAAHKAQAIASLLPAEPLASCWQAIALGQQGKHEEAAAQFEQIARDHPGLLSALVLLGEMHARRGEVDQALQAFQEALVRASEQDVPVIQFRLGQLHEQKGSFEDAIASYEMAVDHPGVGAYACNNLAWIMVTHRDDPTAALPLAEKALERGGRVPEILDTLGWVHCAMGNAEEAIGYLEAARRGMPGVPDVRYHLGIAYLKAGRKAEAKAELQEALGISQTFSGADEAITALDGL